MNLRRWPWTAGAAVRAGVLQAHAYSTAEPRRPVPGGAPCLAALRYYSRTVSIAVWSSMLARRGRYTSDAWCAAASASAQAVEAAGGTFSFDGTQALPGIRWPVVFAGNHMSMLETFVLPGLLAGFAQTTTVVKDGLMRYPVFGAILRALNAIAVTRTRAAADLRTVLTEGTRRLERGVSVLIFPQATRMPVFRAADFNTLGLKLAKHAGVPLVPFALRTDFQANGRLLKDFGPVYPSRPVHMALGRAIGTDVAQRDAQRMVLDFITGKLESWGSRVER